MVDVMVDLWEWKAAVKVGLMVDVKVDLMVGLMVDLWGC
jgi:hypothetical protein